MSENLNEINELKVAEDSVAAKTERFTQAVGHLEEIVDEKVERAKEVVEKVKRPFEAVHDFALKARDTGAHLSEKAEASFLRIKKEAKEDPVSFGVGAFFGGVFIISMIVVVRELIRAKSAGSGSDNFASVNGANYDRDSYLEADSFPETDRFGGSTSSEVA